MKLKYVERHHGYYLDGKRCKGVSTVAKIPDDNYALDQWRKRMVAIGLAFPESPLLPLIRTAYLNDDRKALDALAEQALTLAGGHEAAEAGTAAHTTTELSDRGEEVEDSELVVPRWHQMLRSAGLQIETDLIERFVIHPDQRICGRFDRYARRLSDGMLAPIDLKTGASAVKYPHAVACQLALYAHAPYMTGEMAIDSVEVDDEGVEWQTLVTEEFVPVPEELDRRVGYMLHMPDDGEPQVYAVNLTLGWKVCQEVIFPTIAWRQTPTSRIVRPL